MLNLTLSHSNKPDSSIHDLTPFSFGIWYRHFVGFALMTLATHWTLRGILFRSADYSVEEK